MNKASENINQIELQLEVRSFYVLSGLVALCTVYCLQSDVIHPQSRCCAVSVVLVITAQSAVHYVTLMNLMAWQF